MQKTFIPPFFSLSIKTLIFFSSALYLFGFSLSGVNVFGYVDALIPFERSLCLVLSIGLTFLFGNSFSDLMINLFQKKKVE